MENLNLNEAKNIRQNYKRIFLNSEISTNRIDEIVLNGIKKRANNTILYRIRKFDSNLYFILYDFKNIYFCKQTFKEIQNLNKNINSSLEFNDVLTLINFIIDNVLKQENNCFIAQNEYSFNFECLVDIIKVKWLFECEILEINQNENDLSTNEMTEDLFVKPLINVLFALQNFISSNNNPNRQNEININDVDLTLKNLNLNKPKNFNKLMSNLTQKSSEKFLTEGENLKRKNTDNSINLELGNKNEKIIQNNKNQNPHKDLNNKRNNNKISSKNKKGEEIDKSQEITDDEFSSVIATSENFDGENKKIVKDKLPIRKKKNKLKFV